VKCFHCQAQLTRQDVCLKCGTDVRLYKKIIYNADHLYNLGLEKANQRDLTAARNYLRQSLQLYKEHIPARNLLGLVYYALGEPAQALREWVLSENFQPEENPASEYLHRMEKSMSVINGSITRYNQALMYLELGSRDLALIQMKQLMGRSYQMIRAKQLMALLYMQDGYFNRAQKLLRQCIRLDRGDPTTRRYLQALEKRKAVGKDSSIRQAVAEAVETPREADVIIPQNNREYGSYFMYVLYIMIGLLLGAGLVYYIVVPTVRRQEQDKNRTAVENYEDGMSVLRGEIVDYTADINRLNDQISLLQETIDKNGLSGDLVSYESLLPVLVAYINNDVESIMDEFALLDPDIEDELYQNIYTRLYNDYNDNMGYRSFYRAMEYVDTGEYQKALPLFELTYLLNGMDARVLYYIGICHELTSDYENALYYYQYTIVHYPSDAWAQNASERLKNILSIHEDLTVPDIQKGDALKGITTEKPGTVADPSGNDIE
jgi:tetratricopeptide (TPR) repeat protein